MQILQSQHCHKGVEKNTGSGKWAKASWREETEATLTHLQELSLRRTFWDAGEILHNRNKYSGQISCCGLGQWLTMHEFSDFCPTSFIFTSGGISPITSPQNFTRIPRVCGFKTHILIILYLLSMSMQF